MKLRLFLVLLLLLPTISFALTVSNVHTPTITYEKSESFTDVTLNVVEFNSGAGYLDLSLEIREGNAKGLDKEEYYAGIAVVDNTGGVESVYKLTPDFKEDTIITTDTKDLNQLWKDQYKEKTIYNYRKQNISISEMPTTHSLRLYFKPDTPIDVRVLVGNGTHSILVVSGSANAWNVNNGGIIYDYSMETCGPSSYDYGGSGNDQWQGWDSSVWSDSGSFGLFRGYANGNDGWTGEDSGGEDSDPHNMTLGTHYVRFNCEAAVGKRFENISLVQLTYSYQPWMEVRVTPYANSPQWHIYFDQEPSRVDNCAIGNETSATSCAITNHRVEEGRMFFDDTAQPASQCVVWDESQTGADYVQEITDGGKIGGDGSNNAQIAGNLTFWIGYVGNLTACEQWYNLFVNDTRPVLSFSNYTAGNDNIVQMDIDHRGVDVLSLFPFVINQTERGFPGSLTNVSTANWAGTPHVVWEEATDPLMDNMIIIMVNSTITGDGQIELFFNGEGYPSASDPTYDQTIPNETAEYKLDYTMLINATDDTNVTDIFINDTTNFNITLNGTSADPNRWGNLTNLIELPLGGYPINITILDGSGATTSQLMTVTCTDTRPATWNQTPTDWNFLELGATLAYIFNASDLSQTLNYYVNDTTNFLMGVATGILSNNIFLTVGYYPINVTVKDDTGNILDANITINVSDTTAATWNETPSDQTYVEGIAFSLAVNASDYDQALTYHINDTTNFTISGNTIINGTGLTFDTYYLEIIANDSSNNQLIANIKITKSGIQFDQTPGNYHMEHGGSLLYIVNVSETTGIGVDTITINDTTTFGLSVNGSSGDTYRAGTITDSATLAIGYHHLKITANDTNGNSKTANIYINVTDTTSPTLDQSPTNFTFELVGDNSYSAFINCSDLTTIAYTTNSSKWAIDSATGELTNSSSGVEKEDINITCLDTSNNGVTLNLFMKIEDTTTPVWVQTPTDQVYSNGSLTYDFNATDLSVITYHLNDTSNFTIALSTGIMTNNTLLIHARYYLTITANDSENNPLTYAMLITNETTSAAAGDSGGGGPRSRFGYELIEPIIQNIYEIPEKIKKGLKLHNTTGYYWDADNRTYWNETLNLMDAADYGLVDDDNELVEYSMSGLLLLPWDEIEGDIIKIAGKRYEISVAHMLVIFMGGILVFQLGKTFL